MTVQVVDRSMDRLCVHLGVDAQSRIGAYLGVACDTFVYVTLQQMHAGPKPQTFTIDMSSLLF